MTIHAKTLDYQPIDYNDKILKYYVLSDSTSQTYKVC